MGNDRIGSESPPRHRYPSSEKHRIEPSRIRSFLSMLPIPTVHFIRLGRPARLDVELDDGTSMGDAK